MAELNVQPKKKTSILAWLLLLLGIIALIWFLTMRHKGNNVAAINTDSTSTTAADTSQKATTATTVPNNWDDVDFNAPAASYDEITDKGVNVRGNKNYGIYGLGENVLFDENKSTLRPDAEANLKQIVSSIGKRYNNGQVRVYGFTDAKGSTGYNQELAQQRADAVKTWLQGNGIDAACISVNAIGEAQPVASNNTEAGRQQNRRVEIVARVATK